MAESNKRNVESLETKLSKVKAECEGSKVAHEAALAEFEGYKVNASSTYRGNRGVQGRT